MSPTGVLDLPNACMKSSVGIFNIRSGFEVCFGPDYVHPKSVVNAIFSWAMCLSSQLTVAVVVSA